MLVKGMPYRIILAMTRRKSRRAHANESSRLLLSANGFVMQPFFRIMGRPAQREAGKITNGAES